MYILAETDRDPLTGLHNRTAFMSFLPSVVSVQKRFDSVFALLVVDIDQFHRINSLYGYAIGDRILCQMGELLGQVKRPQDYLFRIGDNRYALIIMDIMNSGHAELAAQKIQRLLDLPFRVGERKIRLNCTVGVSVYSNQNDRSELIFKDAENRLYEARELGKRMAIAKDAQDCLRTPENWTIEADLQSAIDNHQLELYYQPKISLKTGAPIGAEALVRWRHPKRGLVSPDVFIPIAERTGLISTITNWVLNRAMRESAHWTSRWGRLSVSINIPPELILQPMLKDFVSSSLKLWKGDHITLILEIIERSLITDPETGIHHLNQLREMGVKISIDDFGTGYSTLSYFQHIPVNELKIDQSFILGLMNNQGNQNIVKLVTDLAHGFRMSVVAEGIETEEIKQCVSDFGVDIGQGYHFAQPMPGEDFKHWLHEYQLPETLA